MDVEIAYAEPNKQTILKLSVKQGASIKDVIDKSNILIIAEITQPLNELNVGIFGKLRTLNWVVKAGDRIEIYRDLHVDPKTARQQRAKEQQKAQRRAYQHANLHKKLDKRKNYEKHKNSE